MNVRTIKNELDLRFTYMEYKGIEELKSNPKIEKYAVDRIEEYLKSLKKSIRNYYKNQKLAKEVRYFDDREAGYYRIFSETDYKSVGEAEENHVPLTCYPDQLGRWYEISHKFFQRSDGKVCGYAWMAMNW